MNITIQIGDVSREVQAPESWNELDLRTLLLFYSTLFPRSSHVDAVRFTSVKLLTMTQHLLRMDTAMLSQWENDCLENDPEHGQLIFFQELQAVIEAAIGGLFEVSKDAESGATTYAPKLNLTKNPWPSFTHTQKTRLKGIQPKTTWLYAPENGLENISLYELAYTFTLFENYVQTQDEAVANRLLAALYRPSRPETREEREAAWFGDRRVPLRKYEKTIDARAEQVATLPATTRRVLIFWFASCRQGIIERYPKVFRRSDDGETSRPGYGWGGVLLAMAGGPAGLDAIADQHYGNGLTWLSMKEDERREMEAAAERAKRK